MGRLGIGRLLAVFLGVGGLAAACSTVPAGEVGLECSGDLPAALETLQAQYSDFKRRLESSPFYRLMTWRVGSPSGCARDVAAGALRIRYEFRGQGHLEARIDPRIELSDQRLTLDGLSDTDGRMLLRKAERHAFGKNGCGIAWDQSPAIEERQAGGDARQLVYAGNVCNCQARLIYEMTRLVQIVFRSAC